jgi:tetratricopeptide (TPR) repeat protein
MRSYLQECHGERRALLFCLGGLFALGDSAWALRAGGELAHEQPPEVGASLVLWLVQRASSSPSTAAVALSLAAEGAKHFVRSTELLLLAERLALEQRDQASAEELYRALIADAWGMHGRRALHYRAGRWLETFGDTQAALAQYQHAFEISCSQGVVYAALTRCARALNQPERVFAALYQLIQQPESERRRAPLFAEAVGVCLHECGDPAQALALLFEAESSVPMGALDPLTIEVATHLGDHDDDAAIMLHELMRIRAERIESIWDPDSKADALMNLAQLQEAAGKDVAAAARTLDALLSGPLSSELSANKAEQARAHHARITRDVA